eukprot:6118-Heterococcus_DN1.PRE.8
MGVFGTVAAFLSTWLGGLVIVAIMAIAGLQYFRAESADDKRERLRAERRLKRKENKDDESYANNSASCSFSAIRTQLLDDFLTRAVGMTNPAAAQQSQQQQQQQQQRQAAPAPAAAAAASTTASSKDAAASAQDERPPPLRWTQSDDEVEIFVPVPKEIGRSDVSFAIAGAKITLKVKGEPILAGELFKAVDREGCNWQIEDDGEHRVVWLQLAKEEPSGRYVAHILSMYI